MKRLIFTAIISCCIATFSSAQSTDSVEIGANYQDQVWYNLEDGSTTRVNANTWDFAFQIKGFAASILANTAYGAELYCYPNGDINDWANLDTSGINQWTAWHNSSSDWDKGAFNQGIDTSKAEDLGWGVYNRGSHIITGDSLFVWKTSAGKIYKVWIKSLKSNTYEFYVADYNNNNTDTVRISKNNFKDKGFAYYSIAQDSIMDLEPVDSSWQLLFGKYMEDLGIMYYGVSGIRLNQNLKSVKVYPVDNPEDYDSAQAQTYSSKANTIGHDWKSFDLNTSSYNIEDSTVYFLKENNQTYWKLIMKDFGGSANGKFVFEKTKLVINTGIEDYALAERGSFLVYPNPARNEKINIIADLPATVKDAQITIFDINGKEIYKKQVKMNNSFDAYEISVHDFSQGVYFINLKHQKGSITEKLILK